MLVFSRFVFVTRSMRLGRPWLLQRCCLLLVAMAWRGAVVVASRGCFVVCCDAVAVASRGSFHFVFGSQAGIGLQHHCCGNLIGYSSVCYGRGVS